MDASSFPGPRSFARFMLRQGVLPLRPLLAEIATFRGSIIESILFRDGPWQVELISAMPHARTEMHRHLRCSGADLVLNGSVSGIVNGRSLSSPPAGGLMAQLRTIARGEWHRGEAGDTGLVYLSFQQWHEGEPTFISRDWEAASDAA